VTQVTGKGTDMGSWLGMRPTGKAVEITAVNVDRVVGGRIVEHGGAANSLEALLEIGAIRVVGPEMERDAEPDAAPNSGPFSQSPPTQDIQSSDSQRTSSSAGCG
jgi:hypothetical protein